MTLANGGTGIAIGFSLLVWIAFMLSYIRYGNRFRAPAGRALTVMGLGYAMLLISQLLRHPFGISTTNSTFFVWFQILSICCGAGGTTALLWLMIRANGKWPWQ